MCPLRTSPLRTRAHPQYTTAIPADEAGVLRGLSAALAARLPRGCHVITTDYVLDPAGFELVETIEGANDGVGGVSTGYIHRKTCVGERDGQPRHATADGTSSAVSTAT